MGCTYYSCSVHSLWDGIFFKTKNNVYKRVTDRAFGHPSCLSFVSAPKICLPVIERSKLCFSGDDGVQENETSKST